MIQALIFDFDGLILDTETPIFRSWQELYAAHGGSLTIDQWAHVVGTASLEQDHFARLEGQIGFALDRAALAPMRRQREWELVLAQPLLPGVLDYLQEGRRLGLKIGLASSSPCRWVTAHLERLEIIGYFDCIYARDDVQRVKPDPELFLAVLAELRVAPEAAVIFEDSPLGVQAAKAAGAWCVAVPNPVTRHFSLAQADLCLGSLAEISLEELLHKLEGMRPRPA